MNEIEKLENHLNNINNKINTIDITLNKVKPLINNEYNEFEMDIIDVDIDNIDFKEPMISSLEEIKENDFELNLEENLEEKSFKLKIKDEKNRNEFVLLMAKIGFKVSIEGGIFVKIEEGSGKIY